MLNLLAWRRVTPLLRRHRLALGFACAAVLARIGFAVYTRRVWEDATITLATARNLWAGIGLMHHEGELTQSYSSPAGLLTQIVGEAFGNGIHGARLASLAGAVVVVFLVDRICVLSGVGTAGRVLVLSYVSFAPSHVLLGMAGMETQISTAYLVFLLYLWALRTRPTVIGFFAGVSVLFRPEFALVAGAMLLLQPRVRDASRYVLTASIAPIAYATFNLAVFGSILPGTVAAKSLYPMQPQSRFSLDGVGDYVRSSWLRILEPFRDAPLVADVPVPLPVLHAIAAVVLVLAVLGAIEGVRQDPRGVEALAGLCVLVFFGYRTSYRLGYYFYWYNIPFTALVLFLSARGLTVIGRWISSVRNLRVAPMVLAVTLASVYAAPNVYSWPIDRVIQRDIESGVRERLGAELAARVRPGDKVVLEPPGFIGLAIPRAMILDYPGLTSIESRRLLRMRPQLERMLHSLIADARPEWFVLRQFEIEGFTTNFAEVAAEYSPVVTVSVRPDVSLQFGGLRYFSRDTSFTVFGRRD